MGCNHSPMYTGSTRYTTPVRIGNWYEDMCVKDLEQQCFNKEHEKQKLMVHKAHNVYVKLFKAIQLAPPIDYIPINEVFQLAAVNIELLDYDTSSLFPALSLAVTESAVVKGKALNEECGVVVSHCASSCVRNCFRILSSDPEVDAGEMLKYEEKFRIQCLDSEEDPMFVYSAPKRSNLNLAIDTPYTSKVRGEETLPLGLVRGSKCGPACDVPVSFTYWLCKHVDPLMRFETKGKPVPANSPLVIVHMATNRNLAVENAYMETMFGPEFLVSAQNYLNIFRREEWKNLWRITNTPPKLIVQKKSLLCK